MNPKLKFGLIAAAGVALVMLLLMLLQSPGQNLSNIATSPAMPSPITRSATVKSLLSTISPTSTTRSTLVPPTSVPATGFDDVAMVPVPAGDFIMGSTRDQVDAWGLTRKQYWESQTGLPYSARRFVDELPQLTVHLDAFEIDQYEVSTAQYRRCVTAGVCAPPQPQHPYPMPPYSFDDLAYDTYPVVGVRWTDAWTYCSWVGKRLPSEAEWEKAARGTDGRIYPWGNEWDPSRLAFKDLQPVDRFPSGISPYGAFNLLGNAGEWTADPYGPYPGAQRTVERSEPVVRGWADDEWEAHAATRKSVSPDQVIPTMWTGFRCARGPHPPALADVVVAMDIPVAKPPPLEATTNITAGMIYIPAGEFVMGADLNQEELAAAPWRANETPAHSVYLNAYYIDRAEVTSGQYVRFLNALGEHRLACLGQDCTRCLGGSDCSIASGSHIRQKDGQYIVEPGYEDYPVVETFWYGAQAYCNWLDKRLPTEAEWEKAARGTDGRRFPWGNDWNMERVGYAPFKFSDTSKVGSHPDDTSPYGAVDILANATEWVADWHDPNYYDHSPARNPLGPESGEEKVVRSHMGPGTAKYGLTYRSFQFTLWNAGFRCAYTPQ